MLIENFQALISEKNGDLSEIAVQIDGIKTTEQVEQLLAVLSNKNLKIGKLTIVVADEVADFFVSQFKTMASTPAITSLALPRIKLSHTGWETLFEALQNFKELSRLDVENSNFDYGHDLKALGRYLATNPALKEINLCNDTKFDDKTFSSGTKAKELLGYLSTNKNLLTFTYGHQFDTILKPNLSPDLIQKLHSNSLHIGNQKEIAEAAEKLQNANFLKDLQQKLESFIAEDIKDSTLKGTEKEKEIQLDVYGLPLSRKKLLIALTSLKELYSLAKQDKSFDESQQKKIQTLGNYYFSQYSLLTALDDMYQQELKASPHDQSILHNLREDLLQEWKTISEKAASVEQKDKDMHKFLDKWVEKSQRTAGEVKDRTSSAVIKNVLLILGAILTAGIALGIYAFATRKSRAECGHFFFKDIELSKSKVEKITTDLSEFKQSSEDFHKSF
ncbi:hypothetical protein [Legionella cardiaca]|uniref:Ankyrin repeat protein n=1 Tax=Legionella cardiaca TaxID=1071983 RepID=A0ABY8ASM5_9GAMM|nr:hypothetical protein [Legionella cardiaca]WED43665.1 hypothetical protein PXX05_02495 [Legionella cardiaca]